MLKQNWLLFFKNTFFNLRDEYRFDLKYLLPALDKVCHAYVFFAACIFVDLLSSISIKKPNNIFGFSRRLLDLSKSMLWMGKTVDIFREKKKKIIVKIRLV